MNCPSCNSELRQRQEPDGSLSIFCAACGWGTGPELADSVERPSLLLILGLWGLSAVVILGPYFALRFGVPEFLDVGPKALDEGADSFVTLLNANYWWVIMVYVFLCGVFSPTYDSNNVGLFGGLMDNPFSFRDDWERQKRAWAFALLPGKAPWAAVRLTYRFIVPGRG